VELDWVSVTWYGKQTCGLIATRDFIETHDQIRSVLPRRKDGVDVVHADAKEKGRGYSYTLTAAGEAFRPMIEMMAEWGLNWGPGLIARLRR
jgi:HxlR-like helix-turn-helix